MKKCNRLQPRFRIHSSRTEERATIPLCDEGVVLWEKKRPGVAEETPLRNTGEREGEGASSTEKHETETRVVPMKGLNEQCSEGALGG